MVGLRGKNMPSEIESKIIFQKIREYYPHKKLDELVLAFDLALQKKTNAEVIVYDQFTLPYLAEVMDKYRVYVNEMAKELPVELPKQITYKVSNEEKMMDIEEFRTKQVAFAMIPNYIYQWIVDLQLYEPTEEQRIEMYRRALLMREKELRTDAENGNRRGYNSFLNCKKNNFDNISNEELKNIEFNFKRIFVREYYRL
jgi:ribosomal protein S7